MWILIVCGFRALCTFFRSFFSCFSPWLVHKSLHSPLPPQFFHLSLGSEHEHATSNFPSTKVLGIKKLCPFLHLASLPFFFQAKTFNVSTQAQSPSLPTPPRSDCTDFICRKQWGSQPFRQLVAFEIESVERPNVYLFFGGELRSSFRSTGNEHFPRDPNRLTFMLFTMLMSHG